MAEYEDQIHIDKLRNVVPKDLQQSLVIMELNNSLPTKWDNYLETLLKVYKALNPEKVRGYIFTKDGGSGSGGSAGDHRPQRSHQNDGTKLG